MWALLIGVVAFTAFNANGREIATYDSQATKFLALEVARDYSLSLDRVVARTPELGKRSAFAQDLGGHYRSAYPLPSALNAGVVAWFLSRVGVLDLDAPLAAGLVAKLTASALTALTVSCAFLTARRRTDRSAAAVLALAFALGTNMWAAVSQTLWQQETGLFALMGAIFLLDDDETPALGRLLVVGALLGLAGSARPQLAPAVGVFSLFLLVRWKWRALPALLCVLLAASATVAINVRWFGHPLGATPALEALHPLIHGVSGSLGIRPWAAAAGLLFSPSRGLLVFSPIVAVSALGVPAALREGWRSPLRWCFLAATVQFLFYSMYAVWWAGHTYGPRYLLDLLPELVPLSAAGMPVLARRPSLRLLAGIALVWSVVVAASGAFVYPADSWNTSPVEVDRNHERLWDWRDSQLTRTLHSRWSPQNFALFSVYAIRRAPP